MKTAKIILLVVSAAILASSCTTMTRSMKTPMNYVEFEKDDFEFSDQLTGEATQTKILGIDFARLFTKKYGEIENLFSVDIPIIGNMTSGVVNLYALYNMMNDNPGYDVVFYPTYESKVSGIPILFTTTNVKVKARLGKVKK